MASTTCRIGGLRDPRALRAGRRTQRRLPHQLVEYAQTATTLMGNDRILAAHWAATSQDVDGLGTPFTSFNALVQASVEAAFTPGEGGA